jgi:hypothetical protein
MGSVRKQLTVVLFISLLISNIAAQDLDYAKEVVKVLASPEFKGRGFTDEGHLKAAEYIREQYKAIGLKAFTKDYFQPFNVEANIFPDRMQCIINGKRLIPGKEFLVDPASSSIHGEFPIMVVTKQELLNTSRVQEIVKTCAGKVVLIDARGFSTTDKEAQKKANEMIGMLSYNPQILNMATVVVTGEKLSWSTSSFQAGKASLTINTDIDVTAVSSITLDIDARIVKAKAQNVIGYIEGKERPDSFLVVVAHYDHLGMMGKEVLFPGANDNASGVAMLLDLAKYFKVAPPDYSMVFIALSAEEMGIKGAEYFVSKPEIELSRIRFLVNFDLAGTGDDGIKVVNGSVYQQRFDMLKKLNEEGQYLKSVQIRGAACNSDHCMFYQKGVPCFYIYTLGGIQAYHDIFDIPETLPLTEFADYAQLMKEFFRNIK